jgi:transcriptional regulator with XRE-family HTH domain
MSEIAKVVGQRIRNYRTGLGWSQERLAEAAGCHHTYIGQIERGEKNATIESVEKIAAAMGVPMSQLFEGLGGQQNSENIPLACYELVSARPKEEQARLYRILQEIVQYK